MTDPGSIANAFPREGVDAMWDEIRQLQEKVRQLQTAKFGNRMTVDGEPGIIVKGGGGITISDGGGIKVNDGGDIELVVGDLIASGGELRSGNFDAGDAGWRLQPGGNAEFNNITLRGGIVGDDALENPVRGQVAHADNNNFSVHGGLPATVKATATVTVPDGFTSALVIATMAANARNTNAAQDYLSGFAEINDVPPSAGWDTADDAEPGYTTFVSHTTTSLLTGLGSSFHVRAWLYAGGATWTADPFNVVNIDALVLFLR